MTRTVTLCLFALTVCFNLTATDLASLRFRLCGYSPESCNRSIKLLQTNGKEQSLATESEIDLLIEQLSANQKLWLEGIDKNDPTAIREASTLLTRLDKLFLSNPLIDQKRIVVIKRTLGDRARGAMGGELGVGPSNFQNNSELWKPKTGWINEFSIIHSTNGIVKESLLMKASKGTILTDPEPHWDGVRLMYSSIGTNDKWQLFEYNIRTKKSTQLTPTTYTDFDSFDGCYTPDGNYLFCSTATFMGLPCTDGGNKMCGLFLYNPRTGKTRQLTFDQDSNWGPVIMNNGQVMYQRWEYADLPHSNSRFLFSMNPDGTTQKMLYGGGSYFPASFFGARPVPDHPSMFVGIASGHHSVARSGRMLLIDPMKGRSEADGVIQEFSRKGEKVWANPRDRLPDGVFPQFLYPYPLNRNFYLVSIKPSENSLWGLYLVDINNNITLIAEQEGAAYIEPVVLESRQMPPTIPNIVKEHETTATIFMQDVYTGDGLKGIPRGTVKKLRIGSYNFSPWGQGGLLGTIGMDGPWDIKRILGTVDVEEDGSAMFTVPANTPIFVQPLDSEGKALQIMRSWFTAMPGETQSCIGCHESRDMIPIPKNSLASRKSPQSIKKWRDKPRGFSYRHEVQPVLDLRCAACHDGSKPDRPYLKGDRWITDWSSQISGSVSPQVGGQFTQSYADLHRFVRRPGIESDMRMLAPMDVHADQTELMQLINKGHHGVSLTSEEIETIACWIDFNAPFHGRRSDIKSFPNTCKSNDLRAKNASLLNAPIVDTEWLPELKTDIVPLRPSVTTREVGADSVSGEFPFYFPSKKTIAENDPVFKKQLDLGYIRHLIELGNGVTLELLKIPAGTFTMGSTGHHDEMPLTSVRIDKPFWIGRFEVTNAQFKQFNPSHESRDEHRHGYQFGRKGYSMDHPDQPAVRLSWNEAMDFCRWLSKKTGKIFTLPSEAQWEWAARAGSNTPYWFGDMGCDFTSFANFGDIRLKEFASCSFFKFYESVRVIDDANRYDDWIPRDTLHNDGGFISESVGRYRSNPWDLNDLHGNVWEWTLSKYKPYPYINNDGRNDSASSDDKRVVRGGSWYDRPKRGTSSYRLPYRDYQKVFNVGFRVVMIEE